MKKAGVLILLVSLILVLSLMLASAQNQTIEEKAYNCLKAKLGDDCGKSNSVEQLAFSLLAISDNSAKQSQCKSSLLDKQKSDNSFGTIKETSLAIIALEYINHNTDASENYLLEKKKISNLEWYLEIDSSEATQCEVSGTTVNIDVNKKITSLSSTSCFTKAFGDYWLKIDNNCIEKDIEVSCDKSFISTLIYKKSGSNVWHVTSDIQLASAKEKTSHKINSYCFSSTDSCDYEGSLWSALALQTTSNQISEFLPYLIAFSEDNKNLFPETFLYIMTNSEEYLNNILTSQTYGYWKLGTNDYYDTALALLSITSSNAEDAAKSWLETKQGNDGCWNNIKDTAFLLWAAWPRTPITTGQAKPDCTPTYYCVSQGQCDEAEGNVLDYSCLGIKVCCDKQGLQETCLDKGGVECLAGQECSPASALEDGCCLGTCASATPECETYANSACRTSCLEDEEQQSLYACPTGETCCRKKAEEPRSYFWIILLIILIVLVALAIIFRNKLRILIFKFRNRFSKGPVQKTFPRFPPTAPGILRPMIRRPMLPPAKTLARTIKKVETKADKELEETMKKLKEMSK